MWTETMQAQPGVEFRNRAPVFWFSPHSLFNCREGHTSERWSVDGLEPGECPGEDHPKLIYSTAAVGPLQRPVAIPAVFPRFDNPLEVFI